MIEPIVRRRVKFLLQDERAGESDQDHAQTLKRKKVAEVEALEQSDIEKEIHGEDGDRGRENDRRLPARIIRACRDVHRVLEQNLAGDKAAQT